MNYHLRGRIWMWTGVGSCSLLSMPMTQLCYLSTILWERHLFQCHEESDDKLHNKKSFLVYLSIRSPRAVLISAFAALVRPSLKSVWNVRWGEVRSERVLTELLYYFPSFDLKCSFTPSEKPSVFWLVWLILSTEVRGGSERADEDGGGMQSRLPLICLFHHRLFFFSRGLSSDLASFSAEFSDQGREAWNRLARMWTPDSVTLECADCLIDAAWLRLVQRVTEQFIWFWFRSASTLWNLGLQKHDAAWSDAHLSSISAHL